MKETAVIEVDPAAFGPEPPAIYEAEPANPLAMLNRAVHQGASVEVMDRLMTLAERWEANKGRKAFDEAIAAAKAEIPVIAKNREVDFTSQKGRTHYRHEDFAEIARTVDPILGKHGLSYRFRPTQDGPNVTVTCILSHRDGHYEESTLSAGRDESGNKNSIQAVGSTVTYLQRYTLKMALGLAASNDDDGGKPDTTTIDEEEASLLRQLLKETSTDETAFCQWLCGVDTVEAIPSTQFGRGKVALDGKRAKQGEPA